MRARTLAADPDVIERLAFDAWPAAEVEEQDGWRLRFNHGVPVVERAPRRGVIAAQALGSSSQRSMRRLRPSRKFMISRRMPSGSSKNVA